MIWLAALCIVIVFGSLILVVVLSLGWVFIAHVAERLAQAKADRDRQSKVEAERIAEQKRHESEITRREITEVQAAETQARRVKLAEAEAQGRRSRLTEEEAQLQVEYAERLSRWQKRAYRK